MTRREAAGWLRLPSGMCRLRAGRQCAYGCGRHDCSVAHCAEALYHSLEMLQGKPVVACLLLHSPPEVPSPLVPQLIDLLNSLRAAGKIGAWGASVHTVNGGTIALAAGAQVLQLPYNLLQQETSALLAVCALRGVGTLVQSSLCQGWLTEQGVAAARLLLSAPHRLPPTVTVGGGSVAFPELLRRVLELDDLAQARGTPVHARADPSRPRRSPAHTRVPPRGAGRRTARASRRWRSGSRCTRRAPPPCSCRRHQPPGRTHHHRRLCLQRLYLSRRPHPPSRTHHHRRPSLQRLHLSRRPHPPCRSHLAGRRAPPLSCNRGRRRCPPSNPSRLIPFNPNPIYIPPNFKTKLIESITHRVTSRLPSHAGSVASVMRVVGAPDFEYGKEAGSAAHLISAL